MKIKMLFIILLFSFSSYGESRKRIAVLDSGIGFFQKYTDYMCSDSKYIEYDDGGHGQNVVGLIAERMNKSKYCIDFYSLGNPFNTTKYIEYLWKVSNDSRIVGLNLSIGGMPHIPNMVDKVEFRLLRNILNNGVKIIVAAGNNGLSLVSGCSLYPACHKSELSGLIVVGNEGNPYTNRGPLVDVMIDGNNKGVPQLTGTSQSTAIYTGISFSD